MRFVLYSDKSVSQCITAITERLQMPASNSRPALNGWVEKNGRFSISMSSVIIAHIGRTTRLEATIDRENGATVIRGSVADGVAPRGQIVILLAILMVGLLMVLQGSALLGLVAMLAAVVAYVTLRGDYENSDRLLMEVERTLKADPKPPKRDGVAKKPAAAVRAVTARKPAATTARPGASSAKPAARKPAAATSRKPATAAGTRTATPARTTASAKPAAKK